METEQKYRIADVPSWITPISSEELVSFCTDTEADSEIKRAGKGLAYLKRDVIHTSNSANQRYFLDVWSISNPDILQGASINETSLRDTDTMVIHRVAILRNGSEYIDKTPSLTIRVLDDEASSQRGTIHKTKKVHYIVDDLRLGDTFIAEYSIVTRFTEESHMDKKYFRQMYMLPAGYWFFKKYQFSFIQEREEDVIALKKYFRTLAGELLEEVSQTLRRGDVFSLEERNFQIHRKSDMFVPCIEIATKATWEGISAHVFDLYKTLIADDAVKNTQAYASLRIHQNAPEVNIRNIIEYVQDQIAYLYDAEVMHGYVPQSPSRTLEQRSGDCKAKSALLAALLSTIGIRTELLLVNYSYDSMIAGSMPSPFVFNHCIVKVFDDGKEYYVDPVWMGNCGLLEKRSEPFFHTYLALTQVGSELGRKPGRTVTDLCVEETTDILLEDKRAIMEVRTVYRREAAESVRSIFRKHDEGRVTKDRSQSMLERLCLNMQTGEETHLEGVSYKIVSDNRDANEIATVYKATVNSPYVVKKAGKVFRYYYASLSTKEILAHAHKDHRVSSFSSYPLKYVLRIRSKNFISNKDAVVKRTTAIDNDYFHFVNKKDLSLKAVTVTSEYTPKTYEYIKPDDLKKVQTDYRTINDSNFGVGIVDVGFWQFIGKHIYLIIAIIIALQFILLGSK